MVCPHVLGSGVLKHIFKLFDEISLDGVLRRISQETIQQFVPNFLQDNFELLIFIVLWILIVLYAIRK